MGKGEKLRECVLERLRETTTTSGGKCQTSSFCSDITTTLKTNHQEVCATAPDYTNQKFQDLPNTNPFYVEQACCADAAADIPVWIFGLIGGAGLLLTIILAYCCCCKKRKRSQGPSLATQPQQPVPAAGNNATNTYPVQQQHGGLPQQSYYTTGI